MSRGGARPGAGRPLGAKTKSPTTRAARVAAATKTAVGVLLKTGKDPFEGDAHALLVWAYKNPELPATMRLQAAIAAAPFEKPKLVAAHVGFRLPNQMTDAELIATIEFVEREQTLTLEDQRAAREDVDQALGARPRARPQL
jgi:hypothetical protein